MTRGMGWTNSPFRYKKDRDAAEEAWSGRYILDYAYSLGHLAALGDQDAAKRIESLVSGERYAVKTALYNQYSAGFEDEERAGALLPC